MSTVRITHGSATVELDSDDYEFTNGDVTTRYRAGDLMAGVVQALKAIDTKEGQEWLWAIENGAASRGLEVRS